MKNKLKLRKAVILFLAVTLTFSTVTVFGKSTAVVKKTGKQAVSIVYTTDMHGNIANDTSTDSLRISNNFFTHYDKEDSEVSSLEKELIARVQDQLGKKISTLDTTLTISDPKTGKRRIRSDETNGGDFACDAIYWYINEKKELDCDAAVINGGGLRCDVASGDVTINDLKNVQPFGNELFRNGPIDSL